MKYFPNLDEIFKDEIVQLLNKDSLGLISFEYSENDFNCLIHGVLMNPELIKVLGNENESFATTFKLNLETNKYEILPPIESLRYGLENTSDYFQDLQTEYNSIKAEFLNGSYLYQDLIESAYEDENTSEFIPEEILYDENNNPMKFIGSLFLGNILMDLGSSIDFYISKETLTVKLQYRMG